MTAPASRAWAGGLPVPPGDALGFEIFCNGSKVGEHHLAFTQTGDDLQVDINIAMRGRLFLIPFSYSLKATERYSKGVFQSLDTHTVQDGKQLQAHAQLVGSGYQIEGTNEPLYTGPANTLPLSYWNKAFMNGVILNIQTAHSYPATVTPGKWYNLPTANGGTVVAQRYDLTGKLTLSVYYDQQNQWAGLGFHYYGDFTYQRL
jgi:hypothetical protein